MRRSLSDITAKTEGMIEEVIHDLTRAVSVTNPSMQKSLSNFTVQTVYKNSIYPLCVHLLSYDNHPMGHYYSYDYRDDGTWRNICWSIGGNKDTGSSLTEKTAVMIAAAVRDRPILEQQIFQENAGNYSITKLVLLREIVSMYLTHDILAVLFEHTK